MSTCPAGHESTAPDYCDVCGAPMPADASVDQPSGDGMSAPDATNDAAGSATDPAGSVCPHCGTVGVPDALFCEACGYDFTTAALPQPRSPESAPDPLDLSQASGPDVSQVLPSPVAAADENPSPELDPAWVAELWVDAPWHATQDNVDPLPSPGPPRIVILRHRSVLIGRPSSSRGIDPDIDCSPDSGVSRRHAQLSSDGSRWWVEDLDSANGTFVGTIIGPLPTDPIPSRRRRELADGERLYIGGWTRIVLRPAAEGEVSTYG